jgi:galactokinase/galacturonokinase
MRETDGIYGGRFSGAGFKVCCLARVDPDKVDAIREEVERRYLSSYPGMTGKYSFHLCKSADGIGARL